MRKAKLVLPMLLVLVLAAAGLATLAKSPAPAPAAAQQIELEWLFKWDNHTAVQGTVEVLELDGGNQNVLAHVNLNAMGLGEAKVAFDGNSTYKVILKDTNGTELYSSTITNDVIPYNQLRYWELHGVIYADTLKPKRVSVECALRYQH